MATITEAPALSNQTAEFVTKVLEQICKKTDGLKVMARKGSAAPPREYLSSFRLGRWFSTSEYPLVYGLAGIKITGVTLGHQMFTSGVTAEVEEKDGHYVLSFYPDHFQVERVGRGATPSRWHIGGSINLTLLQKFLEKESEDRDVVARLFASQIRAAVVAAIQADERGLEFYRRLLFNCPDLDLV